MYSDLECTEFYAFVGQAFRACLKVGTCDVLLWVPEATASGRRRHRGF